MVGRLWSQLTFIQFLSGLGVLRKVGEGVIAGGVGFAKETLSQCPFPFILSTGAGFKLFDVFDPTFEVH